MREEERKKKLLAGRSVRRAIVHGGFWLHYRGITLPAMTIVLGLV